MIHRPKIMSDAFAKNYIPRKVMCDLCGRYIDEDAIADHLMYSHKRKDVKEWMTANDIDTSILKTR